MPEFQIGDESPFRSVELKRAHQANISDDVLRGGLTVVATRLSDTYAAIEDIVERADDEGKRVIIFCEDNRIEGLLSRYNFRIASRSFSFANIEAGDGEFLAEYATNNPTEHMIINNHRFDQKTAGDILGEFGHTYVQMAEDTADMTVMITVGLNIHFTRKRMHVGDSSSNGKFSWLQQKRDSLNIGIVNVLKAPTETGIEYVMGNANILLFTIEVPGAIRALKSHLKTEELNRILLCCDDDDGIRRMKPGYGCLFNPSDRHNDNRRMPYNVHQQEAKRSEIGKPYDPKGKRKKLSETLTEHLVQRRKDRKDQIEEKKRQKIIENETEKAKKAAIRHEARMKSRAETFGKIKVTRAKTHLDDRKNEPYFQIKNASRFNHNAEDGRGYYEGRKSAARLIAAYRNGTLESRGYVNELRAIEAYNLIEINTVNKAMQIAKNVRVSATTMIAGAVQSGNQAGFIDYLDTDAGIVLLHRIANMRKTKSAWRQKIKLMIDGYNSVDTCNDNDDGNVVSISSYRAA